MSENPYAPPAADLGIEERLAAERSGDFDIGRCLSDGWRNTWANFPLWLWAGIVWTVAVALAAVTVIGVVVVTPVLFWGLVKFGLRMHDGEAELRDIFSGFSCYGAALVGMLVSWLGIALISAVGQVPQIVGQLQGDLPLFVAGYAFGIVYALLVTVRLFFAYFFVVDRAIPPLEAISRSWQATAPVKWKVVGLLLLSYLVVIAGALALLVGVIPAAVVAFLMWLSAFRQMEGRPAAA